MWHEVLEVCGSIWCRHRYRCTPGLAWSQPGLGFSPASSYLCLVSGPIGAPGCHFFDCVNFLTTKNREADSNTDIYDQNLYSPIFGLSSAA